MPFYREHDRRPARHDATVMTKQAMKDECDINNIVDRIARTGMVEHVSDRQPFFADYGEVIDFTSAMYAVTSAQQAFEQLPSRIRDAFNNDAAQLLEALQDPQQEDRLRELGVLELLPEEAPEEPTEPVQEGPVEPPAEPPA